MLKNLKFPTLLLFFSSILFFFSCSRSTVWKGQGPLKKVSTRTRPIQQQVKMTYDLGDGIYCSNEFQGARLNGMSREVDTLTALITPENTPINSSPWYAFKAWSDTEKEIYLKLTYLDSYNHRYYPKVSKDALHWERLDSSNYFVDTTYTDDGKIKKHISMKLNIGPDTLWISAQELITSKHIYAWAKELAVKPYISMTELGKSKNGNPINILKIGFADDKKLVMVLSRQHPPEITGYLAMKSFVETLCAENELTKRFREKYNIYVIPLVNPDGVDNGHWRHNAGGIDLNRDWKDFNQPETKLIRDFTKNMIKETGGKFYIGIDFHSTSHDIYYTINPDKKGNMPGLIPEMIKAMGNEIDGYEPNIRPNSDSSPKISSLNYFFYQLDAEALTFEIGDNTSRERIKLKGELAAIKMMDLMLRK